jgi:hypothetical protein
VKNRLIILLVLLFVNTTLYGENLLEFDYEGDIYYSNVSAYLDLDTATEITDASDKSESEIYTKLLFKTFSPNIFLVEAAVHPMPIAGIYFRKSNANLYNSASLQNFNLVKALSTGFEEPYSFSLFFGRMMVFRNIDSETGECSIGKNRAYIGYLLTVGDMSIKDNLAYYNRWINFEFKLKGTREKKDRDLDWSFRVGYKKNNNINFADSLYIGARRSSTDYKKSVWSRFYNTAFSSMVEVDAKSFDLLNTQFTVEKKFPISWLKKLSFGLEIGYLYTSESKYNGTLRDEGVDNHQLILRPNFKF